MDRWVPSQRRTTKPRRPEKDDEAQTPGAFQRVTDISLLSGSRGAPRRGHRRAGFSVAGVAGSRFFPHFTIFAAFQKTPSPDALPRSLGSKIVPRRRLGSGFSCGSLGPFTQKDDEAQTPRRGRRGAGFSSAGSFYREGRRSPHAPRRSGSAFSCVDCWVPSQRRMTKPRRPAGVAGERDCPPPGLRERNFRLGVKEAVDRSLGPFTGMTTKPRPRRGVGFLADFQPGPPPAGGGSLCPMAGRDSEICGFDLLARSRSRSGSVQLYRPPPGAGGQWFRV